MSSPESSPKMIRILWLCLSIIILWSNYGLPSLPKGTLVATFSGLVPIEQLKIGDKVLSCDIKDSNSNATIIEVVITKIDSHLSDSVFTFYTGEDRWLEASPLQLFFEFKLLPNQQDEISATIDLVQAQYLKKGDMFVDANMQCVPIVNIEKTELSCTYPNQYVEKIKKDKHNKINSLEKRTIKVDMYAIEVEETHTFLISEHSCNKNEECHLLLTHNGIPALGLGISLAFDAAPTSISFAGASLTAGELSLAFGPIGVAIGLTSLGFFGYHLYKNQDGKQTYFSLERANQNGKSDKKDNNEENSAQAPGKPTEQDGYAPSKKWDGKKVKHPKTGKIGWPDEDGNVWVPTGPGSAAHGGPHWDVQFPKTKNGRDYKNVYPGGKVR
jgi:hypothetical protein